MYEYYVIKYRNGFMAIDNHSGGYPYETTLDSAQKYHTLAKAIAAMSVDKLCTGVCKCTVTVSDVSTEDANEALRKSALEKLSDAEKVALGIKD